MTDSTALPSTLAIIKKVCSVALPLTTSRLFNVVISFLGTLFVAHLGHVELAASALITATQIPLFLIASSPLFALSIVAGHAYGAKRYEDIGAILQQGCLRGLRDTRWPMLIGLFYTWICFIPAAYLVGITLHFGLVGISIVNMIAVLLGALTLWIRWQKQSTGLTAA